MTGPGSEDGLLPGFAPEVGPEPAVLVLGTFPSVIARRERAYYANPQNAFWPIVEALFGIPRTLPYSERLDRLHARGIALWDTVDACRQEGSMDHSIRDPVLADIGGWIATQPTVGLIAVNGRTAERFLRRALAAHPVPVSVRVEVLPSTSPANAAVPFEEKLRRWTVIATYARGPLTRSSRS